MGNFMFVQYNGDDAGRVLSALINEGVDVPVPKRRKRDDVEHADLRSQTERVIGFQLEPDEDDEDEDE